MCERYFCQDALMSLIVTQNGAHFASSLPQCATQLPHFYFQISYNERRRCVVRIIELSCPKNYEPAHRNLLETRDGHLKYYGENPRHQTTIVMIRRTVYLMPPNKNYAENTHRLTESDWILRCNYYVTRCYPSS